MNKISLYVHIPFCESKCNYCNFVSGCFSEVIKERYFKVLCDEIKDKSVLFKNYKISSVYFGGGTPSSINEKYIQHIVETIHNNYNILNNCEITIECNPNSAVLDKLKFYKKLGINRISFGVQSLDDIVLKQIGRVHNSSQVFSALNNARIAGFDNINVDFLLGLPSQNDEKLLQQFDLLKDYNLTHISAYMLILESGTKIYNQVKTGEIVLPSDDETVNLYDKMVKKLKSIGFTRYEISNFSRKGYECKHNKTYWNMGEYIGFGVASHSFYFGKRRCHTNNIHEYIDHKLEKEEKITKKKYIEESIMLGLRTISGINCKKILKETDYDLLSEKKNEVDFLKKKHFITVKNNKIRVSPSKFGVCNSIILKLL